jgi:streptogramin lyase
MGRRLLRSGWARVVVTLVAAAITAAAGAARAGATPLTEFDLPPGTTATSLIDGDDGALWFAETTATMQPEIGRITTAGVITQLTNGFLPGAQLHALATGAGGTIWFADDGITKAIGRVSSTGQITEIKASTGGLNAGAVPYDMETAADGTVWFLDIGMPKGIGEISPSGQITEYPDTTNLIPNDLTVAADGHVWFTVPAAPGIGEVTAGSTALGYPTNTGAFPMTMPNGITAGDDGNVWFSDTGTPSGIGRVTPTGTVTEFGMMNGLQMGSEPDALTAGPDGNVWFDDQYSTNDAVGKVTPAGQITEYPLSGTPWDLTTGIDGNLWLPQGGSNGIDRVTPAGTVNLFSAGLSAAAEIADGTNIASGPDGNLWFLDEGTPNAIVRADVQLPPAVTTGTADNVTASSAQLHGSANARGAASTVTIQYGTTPALGSIEAAGSEPPGDTAGTVSATVTRLPANTTIYYRVVASNTYGTVSGSTLSFKTVANPPPPVRLKTRTVHARVGNQRITITVPARTPCLGPGAHPQLKLSSTAIRGSKAAKLSFKRAAVFIDRGIKRTRTKLVTVHHHKHHKRVTVYVPNATVRHLPATLSPSPHGLRSGAHALRFKLTYSRTRRAGQRTVHSTVTPTIKTKFTVC